MTIDQCRAHIGHAVVHDTGDVIPETGVITSVSDTQAFVRYHGDGGVRPADPSALTLMAEAAGGDEARHLIPFGDRGGGQKVATFCPDPRIRGSCDTPVALAPRVPVA